MKLLSIFIEVSFYLRGLLTQLTFHYRLMFMARFALNEFNSFDTSNDIT